MLLLQCLRLHLIQQASTKAKGSLAVLSQQPMCLVIASDLQDFIGKGYTV